MPMVSIDNAPCFIEFDFSCETNTSDRIGEERLASTTPAHPVTVGAIFVSCILKNLCGLGEQERNVPILSWISYFLLQFNLRSTNHCKAK